VTCNDPPTVGVEEEHLTLDPQTGRVLDAGPTVVASVASPGLVTTEIMRYMVEARTPVCVTLEQVRTSIDDARRRLARAAADQHALSVPVGVPPSGYPREAAVTEEPRYVDMLHRFPDLVRTSGTCACHVHIGVPDRRLGLQVLLRLRPWLPSLVALTAASPIWNGDDSGWASRRFPLVARWRTVRAPPYVTSVQEYDDRVHAAVTAGEAFDERSVYFLARLSPRYPTVEVRVADVCASVADAVAYVGLVRALVALEIDASMQGEPIVPVRDPDLMRACWSAARRGLSGDLPDPRTGRSRSARDVVDGLLDLARPTLCSWGDEAVVLPTLTRLLDAGGGAETHRRVLRSTGSIAAYARALAAPV